MRRFLMAILVAFVLASCGLFKDETVHPKMEGGSGEMVEASDFNSKNVMDNKIIVVDRAWITAEARSGDRLLITISEMTRYPVFKDEIQPYDQFYRPIRIDCGALTERGWSEECPDIPSFPRCFIRARVVDKKEEIIDLPERMDELNLGIEMNGDIYPVGEVVEHEGMTAMVEFAVTEEMIDPDLDYTSTFFVMDDEGFGMTGDAQTVEFVDEDECPSEEAVKGLPFYGRQQMPQRIRYTVTVILQTQIRRI